MLRWQRVLAVVVTLVMALALVTPMAADATKAPVLQQAGQVQGKFFKSLHNGKTDGSLLNVAEKLYGPTRAIDENAPTQNYGPYTVQKGAFNLPWAKPSRRSGGGRILPFGAEASAPQPNVATEPDKFYPDDPAPDPWWTWEGQNQGGNRTLFGGGFLPPDTNGDTSGDAWNYGWYVQTINTTIAIWDYSQYNVYGGWPKTVLGPIPMNTIWTGMGDACEYTNDGDPIVLYDDDAGQWMISQFALPYFPYGPFYQCIAVSFTDDPTLGWYTYTFEVPMTWVDDDDESSTPMVPGYKMNDYPKFGVWPENDSYLMSVNQFNEVSLQWGGAGIFAFNRSQLLTGGPVDFLYIDPFADADCSMETYYTVENDPLCFLGGMLPSDNDGAWANWGMGNDGYFMQFDDNAWSTPAWIVPDQLELWGLYVDWFGLSASLYHIDDIPVAAFDSNLCNYSRNCIPQPNTTSGLAAISDRLMHRLQLRLVDRSSWGGPTYESMVTNHTVDVGGDRAGVRWYEVRRDWDWGASAWSAWYLYQQGTIAPNDGNHRWMASAAMDAVGNIAVGYSVSGANQPPIIRYSARQVTDPLGSMRDEKTMTSSVAVGSQTSTSYRWGDYSAMAVAPDDYYWGWGQACAFVYTNEYYRGVTPAEFYTRNGIFGFENCSYNDVEPPELWFTYTPPAVDYYRDGTFDWDYYDFWWVDYFMCSLDGGAWFYCWRPYDYYNLSTGIHTFEVFGVDIWGNASEPISYLWQITAASATYLSAGNLDGYMFESSEFSDVGGTGSSATGYYIFTGDQQYDKQVKGLTSFTTNLPPTAVITDAYVAFKLSGYVGTNPFSTHGPMYIDMGVPYFGATQSLAPHDFEAAEFEFDAGSCTSAPDAGGWFYCYLYNPWNIPNIGMVQFRTYFGLDDNDDGGPDLVRWWSGGYSVLSFRPYLFIDYYVP
jgi:hypothetical protein